MTQDKPAWRRTIRQRRRARSTAEQDAIAQALARHGLAEPVIRDAHLVAGYLALPGEPDPGPLIDALRARGVQIALPVVEADSLTFARYDGTTRAGGATASGLRIPEPTGPAVPVRELDVVLLPALAIDRGGIRLGQGGGYYDRTELHGPVRIAVVHDDEFVSEPLPAQPHDTAVHAVLTPSGVTWISPPPVPG